MKKIILSVILTFAIISLAGLASADVAECYTSSCVVIIPGGACMPVGPFGTPGVACSSDFNACTTDVCGAEAFQCLHNPINCDDGNPVTTDSCNSILGCIHLAPLNCDDGNACTMDSDLSLAGMGCLNTPLSPGTECPGGTCDISGQCVPNTLGETPSCDDGNPCTSDTFVPGIGCMNIPVLPGTGCPGGTCNANAQCEPTPLVPEFGTFMILFTALGAVGIFFIVRRK
ncbi:MAG: hypothetical protein NTZ83_06770 [Candidatus Pacearchaeota archaeon]|nr:hypothetical protein [Candidatus Pacearchaeota archaeon]